jgi:hypothetical protein
MHVPQTVNYAQTASGLAAETPPLRVDDLQGSIGEAIPMATKWHAPGSTRAMPVP